MARFTHDAPHQIVHLRITLDDVRPKVMRLVAVPFGIHLHRLHLVIQAAMGWRGSHLWLIEARDMTWGMPGPDDTNLLPASRTVLIDLIADTGARSFDYIYDLGDDWRHTVKIETPTPSAPGVDYPLLLEATGRCPPEDCGGPWGYRDMLDALRDPKHQRHAEVVERLGSDFDPATIDSASLEKAVAGLARLLSGKKSRKPQPRKRTRGDPDLF
ncbi:MAG: plasmid pRiA4b ORF-3 family protein [Hyphomicrobiaceae bacterium]|nr:plasmid pRiA4b ORF-3 family protein [Hyphomicrobiaceae bacterium]